MYNVILFKIIIMLSYNINIISNINNFQDFFVILFISVSSELMNFSQNFNQKIILSLISMAMKHFVNDIAINNFLIKVMLIKVFDDHF